MINYEVEKTGFIGDGNHDEKILWFRAKDQETVENFLKSNEIDYQKIDIMHNQNDLEKADGIDYILHDTEKNGT